MPVSVKKPDIHDFLRKPDLSIKTAHAPLKTVEGGIEPRKKNSWENLGDFLPNAVLGGLEKDASDAFNFLLKDPKKHPDQTAKNNILLDISQKLEAGYKDKLAKADKYQLPNTTGGDIASTATKFIPDLLELAITPELDVAKIGKLGEVLTKYGGKYAPKVANAAVGKFPVLMGTKGLTSGYKEGIDSGMSEYDATKSALVKSAGEYAKGVLFEGAGKAAEKVSEVGEKYLVGALDRKLLHSAAQATAFSAVPFITNAVQGKGTSLKELKDNAIFGGILGLFHGEPDGKKAADGSAKEVQQRSPLIDMHNFMQSDMDAIRFSHYSDGTANGLHDKAVRHAENAFKEEDPDAKQQQIVQSSFAGKMASVKAVTNAILKDKDAVIDAIPDGVDKQPIIDKINQVHKELDPTEQKKTALANQIKELQDAPAEDLVAEKEKAVKVKDLNKQLDEIINTQFEAAKNSKPDAKPLHDEPSSDAPGEPEVAGAVNHDETKYNSIKDNYPYPKKAVEDMTSDEIYQHARSVKDYQKGLDKEFFGEEGAKEYQAAVAVENSSFSSSEKRHEAYAITKKYHNSLTPEQSKVFFGENANEFQHDPDDLRDIARKVHFIEESENINELANSIKNPLMDFRADDKNGEAKILLKSAARKAIEMGIDPAEMLKKGIDNAVSDLPGEKGEDLDGDKELLTKSILSEIAKTAESVPDGQKQLTNNQITTNPKSNESKNDDAQKGKEGESQSAAEKGDEKSRQDEKGLKVTSGEAEPKPDKPRFQIKGDKITPLPIHEHAELNGILQNEHGITIQDLKNEHEERNKRGEDHTEAAANEKNVQQPENDGPRNDGEHRQGEGAEGSESKKGKTTFKKPSVTGIANADVQAERGEEVGRTKKTKEQIETEGKRLVDSGDLEPDKFAEDLISKPRPIAAEEQSALRYHKAKLNNRQRQLAKDSETNPDNAANNEIEYARNEDLIEQNRQATEIAGNETGRALGDRQEALAEDYSRVNILRKAKIANGGELDPKDEAELITRTKRIEELEGKLADREEEIRKLQEKNTVAKVNRAASAEERNAKREITKASLRKEREGILADLHVIAKKARSSAGANKIPVDMFVPLTKLARNYVLDGAITIAQVADKIYNDMKDHIDGLTKEDIADVVKDGFNDYLNEQNEVRLNRAKKLQKTKLENLKDDDYEKKVFKKILVDNDYLNIRAEINREQQRVNKKIQDIENSKKSLNRKIVDAAVRYGRQAKLASVTVLGKLASTGLATIGIKPVTEGIGKGFSAVLPRVAKRSSVEGSVSAKSMREANRVTEGAAVTSISQAYGRAFTIGMRDAYQELSGAGSNLTNLYKERGATLPAEAKEFFGHLHSAIKAPVKRFNWELSYAKRAAKMIDNGLDPLNPVNDAQNRMNAYKDAEKSIFMGDNTLSKIYENNVSSLEKSNSSINRTAGAAFRILLPFVKVPSNIVLEGAKYSFGGVSGVARLGRAFAKGIDNLEPEEADIILEHLKKGSIGGVALALGFFNPKMFGGFYAPGKKEKVAPGHIKVGDVNIPAFAVEHPIFIAAQVGANFRQLLDKYRTKDDRIPVAALATISGLGYEVPQANEIKRLVDLTGNIKSMKGWEKFGAETLKGEIEPAALQQLAQITDVKEGAKTNILGLAFSDQTQQKRKPDQRKGAMKYIGQTLETGVPGLRKNVPKKQEKEEIKLLPK